MAEAEVMIPLKRKHEFDDPVAKKRAVGKPQLPDVGSDVNLSMHVIADASEIKFLDCADAFQQLTDKEKLYSHYINQASWQGALINLFQTSPESPVIFVLLQKLFRGRDASNLRDEAIAKGMNETEVDRIFIYIAGFLGNVGNYLSFGDTKFIPQVPKTSFEKFLTVCDAGEDVMKLWEECKNRMYSLSKTEQALGLPPEGLSTYYSANCVEEDAKLIQGWMDKNNLSPYNTRLFKTSEKEYVIRVAAADSKTEEFTDGDVKITVQYGDHSDMMAGIVENLKKAKEYVANDLEGKMMEEYVKSFAGGSIEDHKNGSRHWVKNKGPVVETYIGFIESYQDPFGVRGEWEGFTAVVNKEISKTFQILVDKAADLLPFMPWDGEFEKDVFHKPDFTSLDIVNFGSSGVPAGINIPNYDDIRQNEGFKNVSLGNVLRIRQSSSDKPAQYVCDEDQAVYKKRLGESFDVQVALHELLGHGSGKIFMEGQDGNLNFDQEKMRAAISEEYGPEFTPDVFWYKPGQTWDSLFLDMASPMEECRAEAVGIYLCLIPEIGKIFGHENESLEEVIYVNWLSMARKGVEGLLMYSPDTQKFRQAHMHARHVLLRVMIEAGLVEVLEITGTDGKPDIQVKMDRKSIGSVGKKCIGDFLRKLQVIKATANIDEGRNLFKKYNTITDKWLKLRQIVVDRKKPRMVWCQGNTKVDSDTVSYESYPATPFGIISSFQNRYGESDDAKIMKQYESEKNIVTPLAS